MRHRLFTHEYAPKVKAGSITFVDITATGPFDVADIEEYVVSDAELWIEKCERQYDMIVSASAIQWFADIPRFLHLCHERLRPGGVLAISTFTPGILRSLMLCGLHRCYILRLLTCADGYVVNLRK